MSKYTTIKEKYHSYHNDGIFYAFSTEQFTKGLKECGYDKSTKLVKDGYGGFGTKEAFAKRREFFDEVEKEIQQKCVPDEIFEYEYWNYESGYTGDYTEALNVTRSYFPDYTPSKELLQKLRNAVE